MVCAGFNGRTSDDLAKGKNLNYCCDACLVVANEMKSFMSQTKGGLKELINSFGVARDSFHRADDLLSALNSQFNGLKLLDDSKAPQPRANDQQDSTTDQLSIAANPHMLLISAAKTDAEQSDQSAVEGPHPVIAKNSELSALVSQPVIPPVSISLPP